MSEKDSGHICVTCQRPFPDDLKVDDAPKYFGQLPLMPRTDAAHDFGSEARQICEYIKAISEVMRYGEDKEIKATAQARIRSSGSPRRRNVPRNDL